MGVKNLGIRWVAFCVVSPGVGDAWQPSQLGLHSLIISQEVDCPAHRSRYGIRTCSEEDKELGVNSVRDSCLKKVLKPSVIFGMEEKRILTVCNLPHLRC